MRHYVRRFDINRLKLLVASDCFLCRGELVDLDFDGFDITDIGASFRDYWLDYSMFFSPRGRVWVLFHLQYPLYLRWDAVHNGVVVPAKVVKEGSLFDDKFPPCVEADGVTYSLVAVLGTSCEMGDSLNVYVNKDQKTWRFFARYPVAVESSHYILSSLVRLIFVLIMDSAIVAYLVFALVSCLKDQVRKIKKKK